MDFEILLFCKIYIQLSVETALHLNSQRILFFSCSFHLYIDPCFSMYLNKRNISFFSHSPFFSVFKNSFLMFIVFLTSNN